MIEMKVMGIALDTRTGSPIVVLHDKENRKALPIWIGSAEASAIIRKIENLTVARPMTHDLIINIIEKTGYHLDKVEINDVEKAVIKSKIDSIDNKEKEIERIKNISLLNRSMLDEYLLFKLEKEGLEKKLVK